MIATWRLRFLHYPWMVLINQLMGLILLSEWWTLLFKGVFTPTGLVSHLQSLLSQSHNNIFLHTALQWALQFPGLSYTVAAVILLTATLMLVGIYRFLANWVATFIFLLYVLCHLNHPGTWLFEYVSPFVFSLLLALATGKDVFCRSKRIVAFGFYMPKLMHSALSFLIVTLFSACILFCMVFSNNIKTHSGIVAIATMLSFFTLYLLSLWLNRFRGTAEQLQQQPQTYRNWLSLCWLDYCLVYIGVVLLCQVDMDNYLQWFTTHGYQNLASIYAQLTHSPDVIKLLLSATAQQAAWLAPVQFAAEQFFAIAALLLVFRFPVVVGMFGLFLVLTLAEFGVPATWPPTKTADVTWTWELLNITLVLAVIACYQFAYFMHFPSLKRRILGDPLLPGVSWLVATSIAAFVALSVVCLIYFSHTLKLLNHPFMIKSGLSTFLFLCLTFGIDTLRKRQQKVRIRQV